MKICELLEHTKLLSDVIKAVKASLDDYIFTLDNPYEVYVMNSEQSVIYVVTLTNNTGWLPYKTHVVGCVKNFIKIMECASDKEVECTFDNIIFDVYNPWLYPTAIQSMSTLCANVIASFNRKLIEFRRNIIIDSEDILTDPYYKFVFNDIFSLGTGISDIIRTKSGKAITIYKGLIPYTSKDKVALSVGSFSPQEFITCYTISKIKPTKNSMVVNMYTRCLDISTSTFV